jgi:type IV secretory pathway VirD2 relaxase
VIVKARIVRQRLGFVDAVRAHLSYLRREGVTKDGAPARMFDAVSDDADLRAFAERAGDDRHHFRFIVSPEDATEMADLRAFTRDLVKQMEHDLGTGLAWVAIDHWNTDNPHVHLIVRGTDESGDTLVINRDYISHGMRERAAELVTIELGPQSERQVRRRLADEVSADRWTQLDAVLQRAAQRSEDGVLDFRPEEARSGAIRDEIGALLVGRLQKLERMGLARAVGSAQWLLAEEAASTLRELGIRGDIIRTMQSALAAQGKEYSPDAFAISDPRIAPEASIIGRVIEKGLHDELKGSAYLVLDGIDGHAHYVRVGSLEAISDMPEGAIVAVGRAHNRRSDKTIARLAAADNGTYDPRRHRSGSHMPRPRIRTRLSKHMCAGWKHCAAVADTSSGWPMVGGEYPRIISTAPAPMTGGTPPLRMSSYRRFPACRWNLRSLPWAPPGSIESSSRARRRRLPRRDSAPRFGPRSRNALSD